MKTFALVFVQLVFLFSVELHAAYSGGSGTQTDPYKITKTADWQDLAATSSDWNKHFTLTDQINLSGKTLTPIGDINTPFVGTLEGNGHFISNATIHLPGTSFAGLFGYVGAGGQIRNLSVINCSIQGSRYTGGLAGKNSGILTACYTTGSVRGNDYVGGIAGQNSSGTITSCYTTCAVTGMDSRIGGLAGQNASGIITSCYATGPVTGTGSRIGGLAGHNSFGIITACFSLGAVNGSQDYVGGLTGDNSGTLSNCYTNGPVDGTGNYIGGLTGLNSGTLNACYATGVIAGAGTYLGGFSGFNQGTLISSFWDVQSSGLTDGVGGIDPDPNGVTGLDTPAMMSKSTFVNAGWDFSNSDGNPAVWVMSRPDSDYPRLQWNSAPLSMNVQRFTVQAGKSRGLDSIQFSSLLNATETAIQTANNIAVHLSADTMPVPVDWTFIVDDVSFKKGRFNGKNITSSLKLDTKTGKMIFSAKNADLTGLSCPMTVTITIGDYIAQVELDETIVNGSRKPCPLPLIMGVKDSLAVTRSRVQFGRKDNTDSFTAQGTFTLAGDYDKNSPLVITLGTQTFTVPGDLFTVKNSIESCKKAVSNEGPIVDAKLDFVKCTYTILVKNADITDSGSIAFGIDCFGVNLNGLVNVNIN